MNTNTFLNRLAVQIKKDFPVDLNGLTIVLPNKRAKVFLLEHLKAQYDKPVFAPVILSVEDLIQEISEIRAIDSIELLFEFFNVYRTIVEPSKRQDFDYFANWAKMLLQDFNEIDRYLLNPNHVFSYLKDIEDIKHWSLDLEKRTNLIENYLEFWSMMPVYYEALYSYLKERKIGYQGLIYKEAVVKHNDFIAKVQGEKYYFAGFNALNAAEEVIFQSFLELGVGKVFWDIDEVFLNDPYHDAGLFLRRIKKTWKYYRTNQFEWIIEEFKKPKNIHIIQTPKTVGQAKIVGQLINFIAKENGSLDRTAVVLGEEQVLMPILYSLPDSVSSLNITMGYDGKSNPVQIFLNKLFKLHLNAIKRNRKSVVFYYKEMLDVLTNPVVAPYINGEKIVSEINSKNLTFFGFERFESLGLESNNLRFLLFTSWDKSPLEVLNLLLEIVLELKSQLGNDSEEEKLSKTFLYSSFQLLNRLKSYCEKYEVVESLDTLYAIYKQIMDLSAVSFEGEPLQGLQIMGVLESRVLDFENVIITSVNEGKFPSGKSQNSFIPYDVKRELGLPTYKEKDAIYSYHFYHLLLRAKNIYLLYNSQSEGLDAGERSRFLTQLEIERSKNHSLKHETYSAYLPEKAYEPIEVSKSELLNRRLKVVASERGFSPSSLSTFLRNPIQFYMQRLLGIREVEEVEESVALNTLGTIIHQTLENLYLPYVGKNLVLKDVEQMQKNANVEVERQFELEYNSDKDKLGKNLLAFEVAKRHVFHFLEQEKSSLKNGDDVRIIALETGLSYVLEHKDLPYPVRLTGFVDRIEERNGVVRVIDYKTGKVESRQVRLTDWDGMALELKNDKAIQLLCYALMYFDSCGGKPLEAGIYSFKNRREGFLFFGVKNGSDIDTLITQEVLENFKEELVRLFGQILDPDESFLEIL